MDRPLVSVVTPVYNGAEFIAQCIESVLGQPFADFEFVIVNNCSKDSTLAIANEYAAKDSRIVVKDNDVFLDVIANHNHAFSLISPHSKYCKVVCADDWIYPACLGELVRFAEAHASVGIVGSYSLAGREVVWDGLEYEQNLLGGREICRATLLGGPYVFGAPTSLLYRADLMRATPNFFPNKSPHADTSACYQALQHADFGFVHQILSYTRVHAESQTSSSLKFGKNHRAAIADLTTFGPLYLTSQEIDGRLEFLLNNYYDWLVPAIVEQSFNKEFIERQRRELREIGFELEAPRMLKAALKKGVDLARHPVIAARSAMEMARGNDGIQARYY
jgi:glycosyltransferase involved in cell wall biosynthesis